MRRGTPKFRLVSCDATVQEIQSRMPFRYGKAVLKAAPLVHVRVRIEGKDGKQSVGLAADCLPPQWFSKDPSKPFRDEVRDQIAAIRAAISIYLACGADPLAAVELWEAAYPRVLESSRALGLNDLTASFGSSFLERAMIDAVTRLRGVSFFAALKQDLLGMSTAKILPESPPGTILCRHTVGLGDPISVGEIPPDQRLDDGLPQALEEDIEAYGICYFKVKLSGEHDGDVERLSRLAALMHQRCRGGYRATLDGNEQYRDLMGLERLIDSLRSKPYGKEFLDAVLYIEQPLHRDAALDLAHAPELARLAALKPVIIDESDDRLDSLERAIALGYAGVSHKNCKGIFKSLRNREQLIKLNRERSRQKQALYFQTGEDLATVPVVPLQQDLASLGALGVEHAEKNGHHYFRGLDHLPREEAASALASHPDLYEEREGGIFLRIQGGRIALGSLEAPGYGYSCEIQFEKRTPLESWSFDRIANLESQSDR